ncbi:MAG: AEC family transporter [Deltaproteobacteria bacterium]|nr:AEC family transporter [Deltaproteobacteria bacterium]
MQEVIQQAIESVMTLLLVGLLGFYFERKGLAGPKVKEFLPILVVRAALPLYLFSTTVRDLTKEEVPGIIANAAVAAVSVGLTLGLALLVYKIFKISKKRRGIFCVAFTFSNTMFIGLPVNLALFGDQALPHVISYFFFNSLGFWTIGNYVMSLDVPGRPAGILSRATLKRLFSPPLVGFFLGLLVIQFGVPLPMFIAKAASSIGAITTPVAIMYIGMGLADLSRSAFKLEKDLVLMAIGRFLICPLVTITSCFVFGLSTPATQVFLVQSSLPVVASCSILAGYYRSDTTFAVMVVSITTLMSIITIPIFRIITSFL